MQEPTRQLFALTDVAGAHFYTRELAFLALDREAEPQELWLFPSEEDAEQQCRQFKQETEIYLSYRLVSCRRIDRIEPVVRWDWLADQITACLVGLHENRKRNRRRATRRGMTLARYHAVMVRRVLRREVEYSLPGGDWTYLLGMVQAILESTKAEPFSFRMAAVERRTTVEPLTAAAIVEMVREYFADEIT